MDGRPYAAVNRHPVASDSLTLLRPSSVETIEKRSQSAKESLLRVAEKVGRFLRKNWKYILLYLLAWALILACHHAVAVTLTIWLGIGFGAGLIFGIFTSTVLDPGNKSPINTSWNLISSGLQQLDPYGTRQLLLATIIASVSALIYAIPQVMGAAIGFVIGNQLSASISYGLRLGHHSTASQTHLERIEKIRRTIILYHILKNQMLLQKQINQLQGGSTDADTSIHASHNSLDFSPILLHIPSFPELHFQTGIPNESNEAMIAAVELRIIALTQTLLQLQSDPKD